MDNLADRFRRRDGVVGVVGLGYVGLPLAATFAEAGFAAIGFDRDASKVAALRQGRSYIRHVPATRLAPLLRGEPPSAGQAGFHPTDDYGSLPRCDAVLICVPTPLNANREPDLSYIVGTTEVIARYLRPGQLIVLESTTYPGTTEEVVRPLLERFGLRAGHDFHLAFSPEREDPNNSAYSTRTIPKLVGGVTAACGEIAAALYGEVIERVVPVSHARVAEASKLLENIYRSVNIALVNELKVVYSAMEIDIWEVINAAKTKPFGFMAFYPGPGLGGHCIPIDPFYLTWKAREYGQNTRFIELAGEVNTAMPMYVVNRTAEALNTQKKSVNGSRVLLLGLAYKANVDDDRESPTYELMDLFERRGAKVAYYDPFVPVIRMTREHPHWAQTRSVNWDRKTINSFDVVVIATHHQSVNYKELADWADCIVDTRNQMTGVKTKPGQVWKA